MTKTVIEYTNELGQLEQTVREYTRAMDRVKGYAEGAKSDPELIPERNILLDLKARNELERLISDLQHHIDNLRRLQR